MHALLLKVTNSDALTRTSTYGSCSVGNPLLPSRLRIDQAEVWRDRDVVAVGRCR
jgi:hypothetical protein